MKTDKSAVSSKSAPDRPASNRTAALSYESASIAQLQSALTHSDFSMSASQVAQLQKTMGNRAVAQLLKPPAQRKDNETGMPSQLKEGLEGLSGMDLSDVRVHYNSDKPAGLNALAYAQGNEIHVGPGQEEHLPHEGWHVVQQRQGRVQPSMNVNGVPVNDNEALERESDIMGQRALQRQADVNAAAAPEQQSDVRGQQVAQRVVEFRGYFSADAEPEVDEDFESFEEHSRWEDAQDALKLYKQGDSNVNEFDESLHSILSEFESEPNLTVVVSTDPNLKDFGQTTFSVWDGNKYRGISEESENSAKSDEWPAWVTAGNPVRMEITINAKLKPAEIAHTLNHEISLHASSDLAMIRKVRDMRHPRMAKNFVDATVFKKGKYSTDYAHAQLGADKHPRLRATHEAMKEAATGNINEADLEEDYQSDVKAHKKFVPTPYVPPRLRNEAVVSQRVSENAVAQLSKSGKTAESEMRRALQEYEEDEAEDQDWEEEDDEEVLDPLFGQLTPMSCGIASVQMVLATKGKFMDHAMLERLSQQYAGSYSINAGTSMDNMADILNEYLTVQGPKTMSLSKVLEALDNGPVIARVEGANGHFVVIDSYDGEAPEYDGARGVRTEGTRVLHIRDPWPPGQGSHIDVTEQEFQTGDSGLKTTALYIHF